MAQEPAASPVHTRPLAEFVAEIPLGTDLASAVSGVAVDGRGTLYVIDATSDQIWIFGQGDLRDELSSTRRQGPVVAMWGEHGGGPGQFQFQYPWGPPHWGDLAIGPDGNLYVMDTFNSRIQVFAPDGTYLREWGESGSAEGQLAWPSGIGIDTSGRVYVADTRNARVQIFDGEGQFLAAWGLSAAEGGTVFNPADVAIDAAGIISVTDSRANRIFRFAPGGTVLDTVGAPGLLPGQLSRPWGAAVDAGGNLYVAELGSSRVQGFAPDGTSLGTVGSFGEDPGEFRGPLFLTIGPDGLLYVADEANRRVQVFRLLAPLAPTVEPPAVS